MRIRVGRRCLHGGADPEHRPPHLPTAGDRYPAGIPIVPQAELAQLIWTHDVDEVVFAYSDIADTDVMHLAAQVLATGADFRLVGQRTATLRNRKPVVAVCATRSGAGKSQTSRAIAHLLQAHGLVVALIRHPMPYGNLHDMRVQRFRTLDDIDASHSTTEPHVGLVSVAIPAPLGWVGVCSTPNAHPSCPRYSPNRAP